MYDFEDANYKDKMLLGGKGSSLALMTQLGLPVPPGFTITTVACREFFKRKRRKIDEMIDKLERQPSPDVRDKFLSELWSIISRLDLPPKLMNEVIEHIHKLEKKRGRIFGDKKNPLLVSVRSGAAVSMPGMMDTVLNLGLNDETVLGLAEQTNNIRFAYDSYRRFLQLFGKIVLSMDDILFNREIEKIKEKYGVSSDVEIPVNGLKELVEIFKSLLEKRAGGFPQDPWKQLEMAIKAVFKSWMNPRAIYYRIANKITSDIADCTAVSVQSMVFGNMGEDSGTGVVFSRDVALGENILYGEFLPNAQGEDVVAGIRTPLPVSELKDRFPEIYDMLYEKVKLLEKINKEVQDVEFTVEKGRLFFLQTRNSKMTALARVKTAVDMSKENIISREEAVLKVKPEHVLQLLYPRIDKASGYKPIARGLNASPGAVSGQVVFHPDDAVLWARGGKDVILVRVETKPDDVHGFYAAKGILTSRGGMTCFSGDTLVLTNKGFSTMKEIYKFFRRGEELYVLSFDYKHLKTTWKRIIAVGKRRDDGIRVSISQTGLSRDNTLDLTSSHKIYTFNGRNLVKKEIKEILRNREMISLIDKIRFPYEVENKELAYLIGVIFSDEYIKLGGSEDSARREEDVFTQRSAEEKKYFIENVMKHFQNIFSGRLKISNRSVHGRLVQEAVSDYIFTEVYPALTSQKTSQNLVPWILTLDEPSVFSFIAGLADGDGIFYNNRLQIYVSKKNILEGLVAACLRLGILPKVIKNRSVYNVQIIERLDEIFKYTRRLRGKVRKRMYGTKFFSARQLFLDIVDHVNWRGRIKQYVNHNLLIDSKKIKERIVPLLSGVEKEEIEKIVNSDLRMQRIIKIKNLGEMEVYNIEVESSDEMDKNYIVFTRYYTPVLVSNSHAAVVARGIGKPAVVGAENVMIDYNNRRFMVGDHIVKEGEWITIDGNTGEVYIGMVPTIAPEIIPELKELLSWADKFRRLKIKANADVPEDAKIAREYGAEGIGLLRIERMFRQPDRLKFLSKVILSENNEERMAAISKLSELVKGDFKEMLEIMDGLPVTIRLIDPPLHEFLPKPEELLQEIYELEKNNGSRKLIEEKKSLYKRVLALTEANPMMGHRGVRVGVIYPEIYKGLVKAMMEATAELLKEGKNPILQIMVPQVAIVDELKFVKENAIYPVAKEVEERYGMKIPFLVGTMIETVRSTLTADEIAKEAEFFSFGTNDLTQGVFSFSRDDVENKFLPQYLELEILKYNPFQTLDIKGVGELVKMAVEKGRETNPDLEIGVCGEHGGDPVSIHFFHKAGLDYVSASPFRILIARLAAAHAAIKNIFE